VSIVGWIAQGGTPALQFLGETGNLASKLEEQTKYLRCTLAVSCAAIAAAGLKEHGLPVTNVSIQGRSDRLAVASFDDKRDLVALLSCLDRPHPPSHQTGILAAMARRALGRSDRGQPHGAQPLDGRRAGGEGSGTGAHAHSRLRVCRQCAPVLHDANLNRCR